MNAEVSTRLPLNTPLCDWSRLPKTHEQWTPTRKPGHFTLRVRVIRLSSGETRKYFLQRPRPESRRELQALETEINALKREVKKTQIVLSERRFIKQPYRPRRRKKARR